MGGLGVSGWVGGWVGTLPRVKPCSETEGMAFLVSGGRAKKAAMAWRIG